MTSDSQPPSSATASRAACQGTSEGARSSACATRRITSAPLPRSAALLPEAPAERNPDEPRPQLGEPGPVPHQRQPQTAIFAPSVVGVATWNRVRAAIAVSRCRSAWSASVAIQPHQPLVEDVEHPPEPEHQPGVHHVLRGRPPVQPGAVLAGRAPGGTP